MSSTNSRFVQDLNRLVRLPRDTDDDQLSPIQPAPIPAVRSIGDIIALPKEPAAGGISSPLKEILSLREYREPELIKSSDGLFVIEQQAIKTAVFEDANGEQVIFEFAEQK